MDKDIFDSVCNRYEARIEALEQKIERCYESAYKDAKANVCIKHGGHKFDSKFGTNTTKICGFCDYVEYG